MLRSGAEFEHIDQTSQTATPALQEITHQDLGRGGTVLDVDRQALAQKHFELAAEFVRVFESGGAVGGDEVEGFEGFFVEVGGLGFDHFDGHDAEGPHVHFAAVFFLLDDFGGHPVRCADHCGALRFLICEFGAEAEIGWSRVSTGSD